MISMTPKDEVWSLGKATLWRYRRPEARTGPPVMLFLGLVGDSAIFDLHPGISWAEKLLDEGFDVYLFDWGSPEAPEADHTLATYLNGYFIHAVDAVRRTAGAAEVLMGAYCMGALMLLLLLGSRDDVPAAGIVLFTPPCDFDHAPAFIEQLPRGTAAARGRHRRDDGPRAGGRHPRHVPPAPTDVGARAVRHLVGAPVA